MNADYLIVILIDDPFKTLNKLANTFVENKLRLESMEINSAVNDTAWIELYCSMGIERSKSLMKQLLFTEGVIEVEVIERCGNKSLNSEEKVAEMNMASSIRGGIKFSRVNV